jgi:hypothetical protein
MDAPTVFFPKLCFNSSSHQAEMIEARLHTVLPTGKKWAKDFNLVPTIYLEKSRWVHSHALTIHESYDIQLSLVLTE